MKHVVQVLEHMMYFHSVTPEMVLHDMHIIAMLMLCTQLMCSLTIRFLHGHVRLYEVTF